MLLSPAVSAQWPGYFYAFVLTDSEGNAIDSSNKEYKMTPVKSSETSGVLLSVKICDDNRTRRYYEGAVDLDKTNKLKIEKMKDGLAVETMVIEFPSSLSGGKDKFYRDLFAGELKFQEGTYTVKLPETDKQWDALKEIKLCPLSYMDFSLYDISKFQK